MGPDPTAMGSQTFLGGCQSPRDSGSPCVTLDFQYRPCMRVFAGHRVARGCHWGPEMEEGGLQADPKGRESQNPLLGLQGCLEPGRIYLLAGQDTVLCSGKPL